MLVSYKWKNIIYVNQTFKIYLDMDGYLWNRRQVFVYKIMTGAMASVS